MEWSLRVYVCQWVGYTTTNGVGIGKEIPASDNI